jgi:hypothetical protein
MAASTIIDLRKLLAERFPEESLSVSGCLITGLPIFDQTGEGGLMKGAITELSSRFPSAGSATIIAALLEGAAADGYFIALIDGNDSFDPQPLSDQILRHLLWVRCHRATEAMQAADLLLRDGNFPLVILDLVLNPLRELGKLPASNWYRLQRLVEPAPSAFLVLTPRSMISSAHYKLILENRWRLSHLEVAAADLGAQLRAQVQRIQSNKWRREAMVG